MTPMASSPARLRLDIRGRSQSLNAAEGKCGPRHTHRHCARERGARERPAVHEAALAGASQGWQGPSCRPAHSHSVGHMSMRATPDENLHRSLSASAAPQLGVRHAPCSACPFAARPSPSVSPLRPSPAPHLLFISDLCRVRCESASFLLRGSGGCPPPAGHMRTAQCGLHSPGYFSLPCTPRNPTCPGVQACQREDNLKSNDKYNLGVQSGCNLTFN